MAQEKQTDRGSVPRQSGRLDFIATAIDAVHHGAGTSGNTSLLRVQELTTPDGEEIRTPFVSGNSIKHMIRQAGVEHALAAMRVADGSLSKQVVDLLFSGGHLSKSGSAVNLARARQIGELFPILSMCGYSAGNFMAHSKIYVDNVHLVCEENAFRMPPAVANLPQAAMFAGRFRDEEFGTRHEATRNPHVSRLLDSESRLLLEGKIGDQLAEGEARGATTKPKGSSQMIYEFDVIKPGALLWGGLSYRDLGNMEISALKEALSFACQGEVKSGLIYHLGAKSSVGFGRVAIQWSGSVRGIVAPELLKSDALTPAYGASWDDAYTRHLQENCDEILAALQEIMS